MPLTYLEALNRLQANSITAVKVAQDAHVSTLRAARVNAPAGDMADIALAFGYRLLAAQASYAKQLVDTFAQATKSAAPAVSSAAVAPESISPAVTVDTAAAGITNAVDASAVDASVELATNVIETAEKSAASPLRALETFPSQVDSDIDAGHAVNAAGEAATDALVSAVDGASPVREKLPTVSEVVEAATREGRIGLETIGPVTPDDAPVKAPKSARNSMPPPKRGTGKPKSR